MVIRHGTRLPSTKDMLLSARLTELKFEILLQHENRKGPLTKQQLKRLQDWKVDFDIEQGSYLTYEGQDEMILLAERMQKRFPNAIKQKYDNKTYLFRYTATQRTQQSARFFSNGLFERKDAQEVIYDPATKVDLVLRFYKHCDRWQKQIKKNPETYVEQKLYGLSSEMNKTLEAVSKRLGLDRVLKLATVDTMYKYCGYETSWDKYYTSPWCYGFDEESIKVFEYYHDLKAYWVDGYGYDLSYRQACLSIKTMFENFSDDNSPQATFLFTHSGTILKMITHMELYRPSAPLISAYRDDDRVWKLSNIDCFATNLAFVLFKCKTGDHVLTLHQEKVIKLPMCKHELCPLDYLKKYFKNSIYNCNYDDMCVLEKNANATKINV